MTDTTEENIVPDNNEDENPSPAVEVEPSYLDVFDDVTGKIKKVKDWTIPVPMTKMQGEELDGLISEYAKQVERKHDIKDSKLLIKDYIERVRACFTGHWLEGEYDSIFNREAPLTQAVFTEKGPIRIEGQKIGNSSDALTGPSALMALQSTMGIGKPVKGQLWHSGIILTMSNFKNTESLALANYINDQRIELGFKTQGYLFSGKDVNIVMEIVDFVLAHVIATNIKGWMRGDVNQLKELILVSDIPSLLATALESMYPSGYPTERRCKHASTDNCDYKSEIKLEMDGLEFNPDSLLRFGRCNMVDESKFTVANKRHMASSNATHEVKHIKEYQESVNIIDNYSDDIELSNGKVRLYMQQPNLVQYETLGKYWITAVIDMVDSSMLQFNELPVKEKRTRRSKYLSTYTTATNLQIDTAWIKAIHIGEDLDNPQVIESDKTIFDMLEGLSSDVNVAEEITDTINMYKEDTQLTFTGMSNFECPSCGKSQAEGKDFKHGIIPLDMVAYFFTVINWHLVQATSERRGS